jgi:hypothetical protein
MVNLKTSAAKSLAISIIRRVVSTLASLLLIFSIASPFCPAGNYGIGGYSALDIIERVSYWSYKSDFYSYSSWIPGANRYTASFGTLTTGSAS